MFDEHGECGETDGRGAHSGLDGQSDDGQVVGEECAVPRSTRPIRILLVDDHAVMRDGTRRILEDEPDIVVVGEAGDGQEALDVVEECAPDIVVLDLGMPKLDGFKTCQALREQWPAVRILVLTGYDGDGYVRTLHRLGAEGYLRKSASKRELIGALRAIADGQAVYGEEVSRALKTDDHRQYLSLTRKERQILALMAGGMKNREISETLQVSDNTVEFHVSNVLSKLHAASRVEAVVQAQRLGWLDSE
ncbi:MAG TPA: response regulator transcription factor [Ktedonobacterales bacterium]